MGKYTEIANLLDQFEKPSMDEFYENLVGVEPELIPYNMVPYDDLNIIRTSTNEELFNFLNFQGLNWRVNVHLIRKSKLVSITIKNKLKGINSNVTPENKYKSLVTELKTTIENEDYHKAKTLHNKLNHVELYINENLPDLIKLLENGYLKAAEEKFRSYKKNLEKYIDK